MRNKQELIEFVEDRFRSLSKTDMDYYSTYWMDESEEDLDDAYEGLFSVLDNVDWVSHGVTKLVVAFKDEPDYVFKIPFQGGIVVDYNNDSWDYVTNPYDYEYTHANKYEVEGLSNWDYCETEQYVYNQAKEQGVEDLFANTFFLTQLWNYTTPFRIYASQKIEHPGFYDAGKVISENSRREASNISIIYRRSTKRSGNICDNILAAFVEDYGYDIASQFFVFVNNLDIRDLHGDNFGFDSAGHIKVLDYSSFTLEDLC